MHFYVFAYFLRNNQINSLCQCFLVSICTSSVVLLSIKMQPIKRQIAFSFYIFYAMTNLLAKLNILSRNVFANEQNIACGELSVAVYICYIF